jgi:hypothetical protein
MKPDSSRTVYDGKLIDVLFCAEELERGDASPESDEQREIVRWATEASDAKLGEIEDAKTLAGLLLYLHRYEVDDVHKVG